MEPISFVEARTLYCADNLQQLVDFPSECVDLIYLDPPFFSNRLYEVIWGDEAEVRSFEDRWEGGIQVYINWMKERMFELQRVLKPTGSIYLHCDWHAGHYLKVMMDEIFGYKSLQNEIVWFYKTGGTSKRHFSRKHDTILFYTKGANYTFKPQKEKSYLAHKYGFSNVTIEEDEGGWYTEVGMRDVWDIPALRGNQPEAMGYPTQKPEALLERMILASTNKGDLVMDPFCGCGTTIAVAQRLGRQWVGIDISPTAVGLMKRRVEKQGASDVRVVGVPITVQELKELKPFEFQNWVMQRLNGTHSARKTGDMGIDGFSFMAHDPIQVKQSDKVGRKVVDEFETAIERAGKNNGYVVAFSFTKPAREEVARAKAQKKIDIRLIKIADLLGPEDQPDLRAPELSDMFPKPTMSFLDLPLPEARDKKALPSPLELIESDRRSRARA
jgi:DNA modification methylase